MNDLVICGVGPFARLMHYYFTRDSEYRVAAFAADPQYLTEPAFCGLPAIPLDALSERYPPTRVQAFVAIGYRRMRDRMKLFDRVRGLGYRMANFVSGAAITYPPLPMGQNNVAMPGVVIEPFARVGDHNVFWSGTLVCHDVTVGNGNYFGARCVIGGGSKVENGCFAGNGAILIDGLRLADETHILPGSTLLESTRPGRKYQGNPARDVGGHEERGIAIERGRTA